MSVATNIWNILHDGEITVVDKIDNNTMKMFVNIPYLRKRFKPIGDSFVLVLKNIKIFEYVESDNEIIDVEEMTERYSSLEILNSELTEMPIKIILTMGWLKLDCQEVDIYLDSGEKIDYAEIEKECNNYWEEWEKNIKK